jgi:ribonuclease HII
VSTAPTLRFERSLLRGGVTALACIDEAGRGALSGPVSVGAVVITAATRSAPAGVRDSKLLSAERRSELAPLIRAWTAHAVGMASASEIDELGIVPAMRLAGRRAVAALAVVPDAILLDGSHDYLSGPPQRSLFDDTDGEDPLPGVVTKVKADLHCAGVAAASILAKTERDAVMAALGAEHPDYCWGDNKGYAAPEHLDALRRLGPTAHHRVSWRLPSP